MRKPALPSRYGDVVAGISVAFVLVPQSLAYAEIAGMPAVRGLYAAALPPLLAAFFASSPYLQTGPVAITALLTFGALTAHADPGSAEYVSLGLLLAAVVGLVRLLIGLLHAGVIAYLMSQPLLLGFIPAAATLIAASQLPAALGANPPHDDVLPAAGWALAHPGDWTTAAVVFAAGALLLVLAGRRVHPLVPGVLLAVLIGGAISSAFDYGGATLGHIDAGAPPLSLDLPWDSLPSLLLPGAVIALVGFAEAASISRTFAARDRMPWDSDREFVSQGVANLGAAVSGGFPVGGSFSRSSLNRLAGARSRWSGAVTGLTVLATLPVVSLLSPLPKAVLAAIVIAAVVGLIWPRGALSLWRSSKPQFTLAATTFALTLLLSPHVERAVVASVLLSAAVHLWRELQVDLVVREEGGVTHLLPHGVLWFATAQRLEDEFIDVLAARPEVKHFVLHLEGLGRIDVTGAIAVRNVLREASEANVEVELRDVPEHARRLVREVVEASQDPFAGGH